MQRLPTSISMMYCSGKVPDISYMDRMGVCTGTTADSFAVKVNWYTCYIAACLMVFYSTFELIRVHRLPKNPWMRFIVWAIFLSNIGLLLTGVFESLHYICPVLFTTLSGFFFIVQWLFFSMALWRFIFMYWESSLDLPDDLKDPDQPDLTHIPPERRQRRFRIGFALAIITSLFFSLCLAAAMVVKYIFDK